MSQTSTAKKLSLQSGQTAMVINSPGNYASLIGGEIPADVTFVQGGDGNIDFVHLFVKNKAELDAHIQAALQAVRYDALLWISYPNGSFKVETDLNRDILWEHLKTYQIRPMMMMISIGATWSAMRMRPEEAVGK